MVKLRTRRGVCALVSSLLAFVCVLSISQTAIANSWYDQNPAIKPGIPDTGWVSTDPNLTSGDGYCGYVAATNVLRYWDAHGLPNLIPDGVTDDQLMTTLKGSLTLGDATYLRYLYQGGTIHGTSCNEIEIGLRNYFIDRGYGNVAIVKQFNTADIDLALIQKELKACEQLIIGSIDDLAHWVTGAGWYDLDPGTWLGVHDPNPLQGGGANLGGAEDYYQTREQNGDLQMYYNEWGTIDNIISVSIIPEPVTVLGVFLGLSSLGVYLRKRGRARA